MIQHVWEAASRAESLTAVIVATDSEAVAAAVRGFGGRAVMTGAFESGTDRVAHVASELAGGGDDDIVVNLQGDEPMLRPQSIDRLVAALAGDPGCGMATLAVRKRGGDELADPNVVKVVVAADGSALYFSRHPLSMDPEQGFLKHIGVYAFRRDVLLRFSKLRPSPLERAERLEQLRALDNGVKIRVAVVDEDTIAVDTPGDVPKVERAMKEDTITA
jgi:3-deoxy-manno-octulosonate cytidylyltransferase (CMP-KDO synthetase)